MPSEVLIGPRPCNNWRGTTARPAICSLYRHIIELIPSSHCSESGRAGNTSLAPPPPQKKKKGGGGGGGGGGQTPPLTHFESTLSEEESTGATNTATELGDYHVQDEPVRECV